MNIALIVIGKTDDRFVAEAVDKYAARLKHYTGFEIKVIPDIKNTQKMTETQQKQREGDLILAHLTTSDHVVLLDENGRQGSSVEFAEGLQRTINRGVRRMVFVVGGAYGFSEAVYSRADDKLSLSRMTFSHQMVRMIFAEQLYRAFTILKGEPYHHQ